jgi:Tol biopolymer transport system component
MKKILTVLTILLIVNLKSANAQQPFEIDLPASGNPVFIDVSPDGKNLIFNAPSDGKPYIWIQSLPNGEPHPLAGTETGNGGCWSTDSRSIAFSTAAGRFKTLNVETGQVKDLGGGFGIIRGCSWNPDGTILFGLPNSRAIARIDESGNAPPSPATVPDQLALGSPYYLPDYRHFLYFAPGDQSVGGGVYVTEFGGKPQFLLRTTSNAIYSPTGHLLFLRGNVLYAQRFDTNELMLLGDAFTVASPVTTAVNRMGATISETGTLVYREPDPDLTRNFKWFDRMGTDLGLAWPNQPTIIAGSPGNLSLDGSKLLVDRALNGENADIWTIELGTGTLTRLTDNPLLDLFPVWGINGSVFFTSNREGPYDLYERKPDGTETRVMDDPFTRQAKDVSRDGSFLLYTTGSDLDIFAIPLSGNPKEAFAVVQTPGNDNWPQFSPSGDWVAYQHAEGGKREIYVQAFPHGPKFKVSESGGTQVRWCSNGKELYYVAPDRRLMSVKIDESITDSNPVIGKPTSLFQAPILPNADGAQYNPAPYCQRFLIRIGGYSNAGVHVIPDWMPEN